MASLAEKLQESEPAFTFGTGGRAVEEVGDARRVSVSRGEEEGECVEFLEGDESDAIGGHAGTGAAEFVLDFVGEVGRECHGLSVVALSEPKRL